MLKFFKNIRYKMLTQSRAGRYILYAVGEIILVVIGILIALKINNANQERQLNEQEQVYLSALQEEFQYNKSKLEEVMEKNSRFADAAEQLLKHTGPGEPELTTQEFSNLILRAISSEVIYLPSSGVLEEIISSGKLDLFDNPELRQLLSSWDGVMTKVRFQETELSKYRIQLTDLWDEYGLFRQSIYDSDITSMKVGPSKFNNNNLQLLQLPLFENNLTAFVYSSRFANINYYSDLEEKIIAILEVIDQELE